MPRAAVLLALWLLAGAAGAQDAAPPIRSIAFEGNDVTQPQTMLREMVVGVGDPADPARVERSRQGIQDLGLFRKVDVRQEPVDGGVALTFVVEEKWYILPIPRADANSEGENAYGASLRWFNLFGLNHTLRGNWTRRDEQKVNKGTTTSYSMSYSMPFLHGSPWGAGFSVGHVVSPTTDPVYGEYDETTDNVGIALTRSFATGPASQGWSTALSLGWTNQKTQGPTAPPPSGHATMLGLEANYRDVRNNLYSEDGIAYGVGVRGANEGLGSDYSFGAWRAHLMRYTLVGESPHQNLNYFGSVGGYHGGPPGHRSEAGTFALGGASVMRAYPGDYLVGDAYWHAGFEYARPLFADWLRPVVVFEAGNAYSGARSLNSRVYTSLGIGLRVRLTFLVNVEVEAGVAWPLDGTRDQRFFASKV
jgi:outer membrane protein assembly factor BamA